MGEKATHDNTNKAIMLSMAMSLCAKALNFGQSMVVSYAFGTNQSTDILFYSLSMLLLLTAFLGAVNHQVIVPTVIDLRNNQSEERSKEFMSYIYVLYAGIGLVGVGLLMVSPENVLSLLSRFPGEAVSENMGIIRFIIPSLLLIILNTYILDIFTSYKYFTFPMILDILKNLMIIAVVLGFRGRLGEESLAIGILAGNTAQFLVLNTLMVVKLKIRPRFRRYAVSGAIKKNILYVITGRASTMLNDFLMIFLLSGFTAGVFSAMDYAFKIDTVLNMVIVGQITTVVGIKILELHAGKSFEELKKVFLKYLSTSLYIIFPLCFILALNARPVISLLFQRGSFGSEDAEITALFLRLFVLTVPLELVNGFIVILIIAKQIQRIAFRWQIFQNVLNIAIMWYVVGRFGYVGYPAGILVSYIIYILLLCYFLLKSEFGFIGPWAVIRPCFQHVILNLCVSGAVLLIFRGFDSGTGHIADMVRIICVASVYAGLFIGTSYLSGFHRETLEAALNRLKGLLWRRKLEA